MAESGSQSGIENGNEARPFGLLGLLSRETASPRVAVFRALQLGDMLCAVPALRALRAAVPQAKITLIGLPWAAQFAQRFAAYVDDFLAYPGHPQLPEQPVAQERLADFTHGVCARGFDLALQLHGSGTVSNGIVAGFKARRVAGYQPAGGSGDTLHFLDYQARGSEAARLLRLLVHLGAPDLGTQLEFPLLPADEEELRASGLMKDLEGRDYVCLHAGARHRAKCWPPQCFAAVGDRLAEEFGVQVVLTGSGQERELAAAVAAQMRHPALNAAAPISIGAMAALMAGARLLVCNDTGVSHIAAGLRLPSVVVFGQPDLERWAPLDTRLHRCLRAADGVPVDAVLEQARALLSG